MGIVGSLEAFALFVGYLVTGLILLAGFVWAYIRLTPYDDVADIAEGRIAPAIAMAGAMVGFTLPLVVASYLHAGYAGFVLWSLIACGVQLGVFAGLYRVMPKVIEANNAAGATLFAAAAICAGLMNAASFIP